jgi:PAS domain S-box-containing protein
VRERLARAVFEGSLDGMVIADDAGAIVEANGAAAAALGLARDSLVGRSLADGDLFHWGGEAVERIPDPRQGRAEGEVAVRLPSGDRWLEWAAVGRILPGRHLLVLRDVTERRAMQAKLALADRMISVGALAAGVAHELNNPLAYLATNLAYLSERLPEMAAPGAGRDEACAALEEASEGAERMRLIIADLRTFSRAPPERRGPVELGPVLQSCINMAWNEIRHRARLERDFDRAPAVLGNEARLAQVFVNLLVNAAQAIPEGAAERNAIRVAARAAGDGLVVVEIRDTGQGIPPENLGRIFEPFYTTKPAGMGTGLGLSICKDIVESLGGRIDVESEPAVGTSVRVLLRAAEVQPPAPAPPPAPPPLPRRRVLVVDDEPLIGAALRRALDREHDVTLVASARAGLDLVRRRQHFDAVVCDILMPEMGGPEFHRELQALDPALARHTLFLTAGAFTAAARAFLELPDVTWLEKPFELDGLRSALGRVLAVE